MAGLNHTLYTGEQRRLLGRGVAQVDRQQAAQSQQSASRGMQQGAILALPKACRGSQPGPDGLQPQWLVIWEAGSPEGSGSPACRHWFTESHDVLQHGMSWSRPATHIKSRQE